MGGINFEVDDKQKAENEVRTKAVDQAKKKASDASKIAGFKLGRIINYTESLGGFPQPMPLIKAMDSKGTVETSTQVEPGSTDITITITLSYEIQ